MANKKIIRTKEFSVLKIARADAEKLKKGVLLGNPSGVRRLRELVIDYVPSSDNTNSSLKTLRDASGHLKIIDEHSYRGIGIDLDNLYFARYEKKRFIIGNPGYDEREKRIINGQR